MLVADEELGRRASGCGALWKQRQTLGCDASRRRRKAPDYDASRSEEAIQVRATAVASRGAGSAPCSLVGVPSCSPRACCGRAVARDWQSVVPLDGEAKTTVAAPSGHVAS
jgi:hypothetical protein